jgi:plasmid maintenance system killer protein
VDILFEDGKLAKECGRSALLQKRHGQLRAQRIMQRLEDIASANSLEDFRSLPGRCHELHGGRSGQLSLDLDHPYRLVFCPSGDGYKKPDGGLDWTKITIVKVLGVFDTHE